MTKVKAKRIPKKQPGSRVQFMMQSVRMSRSDNRMMKAVARRNGVSFNLWALQVLTEALQREQRKREKEQAI